MARYNAVATSLSSLSNRELRPRLDGTPVVGSGIGGTSALMQVEGTPVFVKRVPLTDLERRPEHVMSTANLFALPTFYQYGVGSTGFGVWRELAAHSLTTSWEIEQQSECFPLMYHWRVLAGPPPAATTLEERADLEGMVAYWDGSPAVRKRLEAIAQSSASVVFFLEYVPQNLREWLTSQAADRGDVPDSALAMVERQLRSGSSFMDSNGLLHFDAHFQNILTDGRRLYFSDFGLATSSTFDLSEAEVRFSATNRSHDACYTVTQLVNWLVTALAGADDRIGYIQRCAEGGDPENVAAPAAAIIKRHAAIAVVMNDFYWKLHGESRTTPYPVDEIQRVIGWKARQT